MSNSAPNTPTISAGTPTSSGVTLTGSAFSDPDGGDTQAAAQWQVTTSADTGYASPVISTGDDATNKTSYAATGLSASTAYIARVRYKDSAGNYSAWSTSASFTTTSATVNRADTFNRADSATALGTPSDGGSAWTPRAGTVGVSGNQAYCVAANSSGAGVALNTQFEIAAATLTCSANGTFVVSTTDRSGGFLDGVMFRYVDDSNYWLFMTVGNNYYVFKIDTGVSSRMVDGAPVSGAALDNTTKLKGVLTSAGFDLYTITGGVETHQYGIGDTHANTGVEQGVIFTGAASTNRLDDFSWTGA